MRPRLTLPDAAPSADPAATSTGRGARAVLRGRRRGLVVLTAGVVTQIMTAPGQTVGISVFVDHIARDLDLTRSAISAAYMFGTAAGALSLPLGRVADRVSARVLVPAAMLLLGAAPLLLSAVHPGVTAIVYGLVLGAAAGSIRTVEAATLPPWFGIANIGELRGIVLAVAVGASATGPLLSPPSPRRSGRTTRRSSAWPSPQQRSRWRPPWSGPRSRPPDAGAVTAQLPVG